MAFVDQYLTAKHDIKRHFQPIMSGPSNMTLISSKEKFMIEGYNGYKLLCQIDKIFVKMTNEELRPEKN